MIASELEKIYYGDHIISTAKEDDCSIYRIEDEDGSAVITRYDVFSGIALVYNDVHKQEVTVNCKDTISKIFEINHCREGSLEYETINGEYMYIKKGDMAVNTKGGVRNYSYFPLAHYHGVTIEINFDIVEKDLPDLMKKMHIDISKIRDKFQRLDRCLIFRKKKQFDHLFTELYCVPDLIRSQYYKIKVMEILLFLSVLDPETESVHNKYYNKSQVAVIKEVKSYLVSHMEAKITIEDLTNRYHMSATNMKKYFSEVYGNSIYAYIKEQRIRKAADLLRSTDHEISTIAGMVGYDNASKFAVSFRSIIGINPSEYRKSV